MTESDRKKLIRSNTILWLAAMVVPAMFDLSFKAFASGPVKFPWPMIVPFLFMGLLLASNKLLTTALDESANGSGDAPDGSAK